MDTSYIEILPTLTCPTCNGKKFISKGNNPVYVALIPATDNRLKPPRICIKITISVIITLLIFACVIYFLITRNISLSSHSDNIVPDRVIITPGIVQLKFRKSINVTNNNYFPFYLSRIIAAATVDGLTKQIYNSTVVGKVELRSTKEIYFNVSSILLSDDIWWRCSVQDIIHKLYYFFNIEVFGTAIGQSIQSSLSISQSVNCGENSTDKPFQF